MTSDSRMFAPRRVELVPRSDGSSMLRSTIPLAPYPNDVGSLLRRWAHDAPERTFLAERGGKGWRTISYAATFAAVRAVASDFLARGLNRDTPVAILSENSIAHALVSLAALYAGIPVAPISPAYSTGFGDLRRLRFVLDALQPALVFAADAEAYREALGAVDPGAQLVVERGTVDGRAVRTLDELIAAPVSAAVDAAHDALRPDDVAKILFTSGSTGEPKGVITTHRMLCSNQQSLAQLWPFLAEHELVLVDWLPWHHTFGGSHNFNMALFHGGTLYVDDGRPVPGRFERSVRNLTDVPPTVYFNVPRGHRLLVDALEADRAFAARFFSRLRLIANAAAALPHTTWAKLQELAERETGGAIAVTAAWGGTETSPMATAVHYPLEHPGDIGLPGPGTELLLVPAEHKLEVRVRGPLVTPGYWRRPDLTAAAFDADGFYRIGDAVRFSDPADPARGLLFDGRLAENFKLSSGTWVDVGALRLAVIAATAPLIDEVVVAGADRDEIGLLLFASPAARDRFADGAPSPTAANAALRAEVERLLQAYNASAAGSSQRVACALILTEPLSPAEGELTDKGSVNQRRVLERRTAEIERLYAGTDPELLVPGAARATPR